MGIGDGYLIASLGILIGNMYNLYVIAISSVLASIYALFLVTVKKKRFGGSIPFAPFVMAGFAIVISGRIAG